MAVCFVKAKLWDDSLNGNIFRVTDALWRESTAHCGISLANASDTDLWCFLWSAPEHTVNKNRDAGDLRRFRAHHDITVAFLPSEWVGMTVMQINSTERMMLSPGTSISGMQDFVISVE